jgi:hypothetical protein
MSEEVVVEHEITIASPQAAVFNFAAEYANDPQWRSEVKWFEYTPPLRAGVVIAEHSEFQGQELVTRTVITDREPPRLAKTETPPDAPHHLVSTRTVTPIDEHTSRFTYRLVFDREILRSVLPQLPSAEDIASWYGGIVRSYLETLKKIIESGSATNSPGTA